MSINTTKHGDEAPALANNMPDSNSNQAPNRVSTRDNDLKERISDARRLLDYAISANLDVPDHIIETLNEASTNHIDTETRNSIDMAIRDLTAITYPTTIATLKTSGEQKYAKLPLIILIVGLLALVAAVYGFHGGPDTTRFWPSIVAISLGLLGAIVNVFFHLIGVMRERAVDEQAALDNAIRIVLGGILGWLLYFTIRPDLGDTQQTQGDVSLIVLVPFLAGFSTRLVFGVLNQAVRAVELTLGIEDTSTELLRRSKSGRSRPKRTASAGETL